MNIVVKNKQNKVNLTAEEAKQYSEAGTNLANTLSGIWSSVKKPVANTPSPAPSQAAVSNNAAMAAYIAQMQANQNKQKGLGAGAIVGISLGGAAVVGLMIFAIVKASK